VGLYGLYLLYAGLPVLMKSPREKSMGYTIAVIIAAIVIFVLIGMVSRVFVSYPTPGAHMPGM
jgi:lipopolysaccharide export LptBFGC system permease protein LptF